MIKILFTLSLICLTSCNYRDDGRCIIKTDSDNRLLVDKFEFERHDYIKFKNNYNVDAGTGIVHNPECKKCFQQFD